MRAECIKDKLQRGLMLAEKVTGKNLSLPVLSHVLLIAKGKNLTIRATNLDLGVEFLIPARVDEPGEVAISGAVIANFLSNLAPTDKVSLVLVGNNLSLSAGRHSSILKTFSHEDFPSLPRLNDTTSFELAAETLAAGLRTVSYASALSDIKPEISSVYCHTHDGDLIFVATDSFRLAEKRLSPEKVINSQPRLILPHKNTAEILRIFEDIYESVTITYDNNQVSFETPGIYVTSRLVDGVFPDYRQIMPTSAQTVAVVLKSDLVSALKLSNVFSDRFNQITLRVAIKEGLLEINAQNNDVGEHTTQLDATLQGEDLAVSINVRYLLDCFSSLSGDSVTLKFNGKNKPVLISAVGDNSFSYLIMPLNR